MRRRLLPLFLLMIPAGPGCGPPSVEAVLPTLDVETQSLDFGDVAIGVPSPPMNVQLEALTSAEVTLSFSVSPPGLFTVVSPAPTSIAPRGQATVSLIFTPAAAMPYVATLTISSNDKKNPTRQVALSGTGATAAISVMPTSISLAAVACPANAPANLSACSDSKQVTISNTGVATLHVSSVAFAGSSGGAVPPGLTMQLLEATPLELVGGDSVNVTVQWTPPPTANGSSSASLLVTSDDPMNPSITVAISLTSTRAQPPQVCLNALAVEQTVFMVSSQGQFSSSMEPVDGSVWIDPSNSQQINVSPGWQVTLTSLVTSNTGGTPQVDASAEQSNPCTFDPQGTTLTYDWSLLAVPSGSAASVMPQADGSYPSIEEADGVIGIDATGSYTVQLRVTDAFGLSATATFTIDAQPHDDLLTQIHWTSPVTYQSTQAIIDLDLHTVVDSGPGVAGEGHLLSNQDCYWQNPTPTWFSPSPADEIPRFLRDDQGESGGFESMDLQTVPQLAASSYRAIVHYFNGMPPSSVELDVYYQSNLVGTFTPSRMLNENDVWIGADIQYPKTCPHSCTGGTNAGCCPPTVTAVDVFCTLAPGVTSNGEFTGMVTCPSGTTL